MLKHLMIEEMVALVAPCGGQQVREHRLERAIERLAQWRAKHAARLKGLDPVALIREGRDRR